MTYNQYTDGEYVYYVAPIYGDNMFAVCKKKLQSDKLYSLHRYRGRDNNPTNVQEKAQRYLEELAVAKGWQLFFEEI